MATSTIKIRASLDGEVATVKALIKHPMETGARKDKATGELVPAHYIQEVACELNGTQVLRADWGTAVSKNPYLSFRVKGAKLGDKIKVAWKDNTGDSDSAEEEIK
jgi:sulfur-oxidizing protein SoxZ